MQKYDFSSEKYISFLFVELNNFDLVRSHMLLFYAENIEYIFFKSKVKVRKRNMDDFQEKLQYFFFFFTK